MQLEIGFLVKGLAAGLGLLLYAWFVLTIQSPEIVVQNMGLNSQLSEVVNVVPSQIVPCQPLPGAANLQAEQAEELTPDRGPFVICNSLRATVGP